ncbi:MAG: response regulator transcription factor [Anaerolineales bacterium]|nr:response regulator transcription factor [Anaerolineales bacterium]
MNPSTKILVVDDEPVIRDSIAEILQLQGYQVLTASNGIEGLEAIRQNVPEMIISDIMMPGMNGYQFYQRVRSHSEWLWIPFIFLSAKGEGEDIRFGKELGVEDYLKKPIDAEDLLAAVIGCLKRFHQLEASRQEIADNANMDEAVETPDFVPLTPRELDVLRLMVEGKNNAEIAKELVVEPSTVKTHVSSILSKLGVSNRVKAVRMALEHRLIRG